MEGREPPRITRGSCRAIREILARAREFGEQSGFRGHELTEVREIVLENRDFFLETWHEYFS